MIQWEQCKRDFTLEGSLRDIYISGVEPTDWRSLYKELLAKYCTEYLLNQQPQPAPEVADNAFAARSTGSTLLRLRTGNVLICCHFFDWTEVEFDIDPRDINSQMDLSGVLDFMQTIGNCLSKRVVLTPENMRHIPIISDDPIHSRFHYHQVYPDDDANPRPNWAR